MFWYNLNMLPLVALKVLRDMVHARRSTFINPALEILILKIGRYY
jgi:hypothetical protein